MNTQPQESKKPSTLEKMLIGGLLSIAGITPLIAAAKQSHEFYQRPEIQEYVSIERTLSNPAITKNLDEETTKKLHARHTNLQQVYNLTEAFQQEKENSPGIATYLFTLTLVGIGASMLGSNTAIYLTQRKAKRFSQQHPQAFNHYAYSLRDD